MRLEWPTYEEIRSLVQTIWQGERPNADSTRYSDLWLHSRILARAIHRLHWTMDRTLAALHPATTWGDYLDAWLWVMGLPNGAAGYGRINAKGSTGNASVTATGATVDLQGYQLTDAGGRIYEITESYAFVGAATVPLDCEAVDVGLVTNLETSDAMTFSSPPANVTAAATAADDFAGGVDTETDAEGRARLITHLQTPSATGNVADWVTTVRSASPGELDAYAWPWRQNQPTGWGLTDYCALQRGASRAARHIASGDALYSTIGAAVAARMPTEHYRYSRQLTLTELATDISAVVTLATYATSAQRCDWDAYGVAGAHVPHCGAFHAVNKTITANKDITGYGDARDIAIDDLVIISGAQARVIEVGVADGLATDAMFKVGVWFDTYDADLNPYPWPSGWDPADPLGTHRICSGGGVIMDLVKGAFEHVDALGPSRGSYASASISGWEDALRVLGLQTAIVNAGDGLAVDCVVLDPGGTVTPTAGAGATTERITARDLAIYEEK